MEIVKLPIRLLHDFSFHQHQIDHFEQLNISTNLHGFDFYGDFLSFSNVFKAIKKGD